MCGSATVVFQRPPLDGAAVVLAFPPGFISHWSEGEKVPDTVWEISFGVDSTVGQEPMNC